MANILVRVAAAALISVLAAGFAVAQDRRQNQPGQFDFFVLSLSWSPSFCETAGERGEPPQLQCGGARPFSFVVHGLWPQYERGFPEFCQQPAPQLDRNIVSSMLDLMPAPGLVFNEWNKHGTCFGPNPRAYFETIRKARAAVKIPEEYIEPGKTLTVTPDQVQAAFVKANPSLNPAGVSVVCDNRRLREVRLCLGKDLHFRDCAKLGRRSCRAKEIVMPPVRGGKIGFCQKLTKIISMA
jgi:ribonuclease T2